MKFAKITSIALAVMLVISLAVLVVLAMLRPTADGDTDISAATQDISVPTPEPEASATPQITEPEPSETPAAVTSDVPEKARGEYTAQAEAIVAEMSLREKICQMFIVYPGGVSSLADYPVGGLVYSASDLYGGGDAVISRIQEKQNQSSIPLIICADEEGGTVNRLMSELGTTYIGSMFDYRDDGIHTAFSNAATIAADMKRYGFNTDLAPVADVWSNPSNTVIGKRAYSDNFDGACELVTAAVEGFKSEGLICSVKHFPGHGDTSQDSHYTSAVVTKSLDELREQEFRPFMAGVDAGADMVMIGHLTIPELSSEPATVSYEIVTGILREELGFDGVIISDGLEMNAVTSYYSESELSVLAVKAGIDILLGPGSLATWVSALESAVRTGDISQERIDESVVRILEMKLRNGLL